MAVATEEPERPDPVEETVAEEVALVEDAEGDAAADADGAEGAAQ